MSYSNIVLTSSIKLSWDYPFTGGTIASDINDVSSSNDTYTITLPPANTVETGTSLLFNNIGTNKFSILNNAGTPIINNISVGNSYRIYLTDNSTSGGVWRYIFSGTGASGISSLAATSPSGSITLSGFPVNAATGTLTFDAAATLQALNNFLTSGISNGFLVVTDNNPFSFAIRTLGGGNNITITNNAGNTGNPTISLNSALSGLTGIEVGNLQISVNTITTSTGGEDVNITTTDTGLVSLNGVVIDIDGNITIPGIINNAGTVKAFCRFSNVAGTITISSVQNVAGITFNSSNSQYTIAFLTPISNADYGVNITCSNTSIPTQARIGSDIARDVNYVIIVLTDGAGAMLTDIQDGVSVMIFSGSAPAS